MSLAMGRTRSFVAVVAVLGVGLGVAIAAAPELPKVSSFAPADDLVSQLDAFVESLQSDVSSEAEYKDSSEKIGKEANTVIMIAQGLGLHDSDNAYKAAAPAIIKAAQAVAASTDFASAKTTIAALKAATQDKSGGALKWEKVAALPQVMKQVPTVNTKMKTKLKKFAKNSKDIAALSATLSVIAAGSTFDTSPAKEEAQVAKWYAFCTQMRDAAAELNKAARAKDQAGAEAANKKLAQSCDDCHAVFKPEKK